MFLTDKYPECFVEYIADNGIYCVGDTVVRGYAATLLQNIEKNVDIQRAKRAGCRGAEQICDWLNGVR